ncbi:VOC family protein [Aeromicrobium phragmitis]|uniref:VOC family protein n=1 Tax=Aeromicrobium phragmitis TaxID=2478914 RepID=A0A3L8PHA1_9ACTN|nr:VOC family protein [Aeromicrobium phragmitis]RLV54646.1 VOC family protein [Aeromicrobium phragmitis]
MAAPLVEFKDLCIDAVDPHRVGPWWAERLGLRFEAFDDGDGVLRGERPGETIWLNRVPEPKSVKHRVHLDLSAHDLELFATSPQLSEHGQFPWTVFEDPEGGEFCVFVVEPHHSTGLKDVVVDAADPERIAHWWGDIWGVRAQDGDGYSHLDGVPGAPVESFDFVPVPEPKAVKNRIHWDVRLLPEATLDDLVERGAQVLRPRDDEIQWTVMADPEGNEFCVFERD